MKRKNTIVLSTIMALLMIVSTFTVGTFAEEPCCNDTLDVTKKVWDGCGWADSTTADYGDDVRFNITITYHKTGHPDGYKAINLVVNDTLPLCLDYNDSAVITHGINAYYGESLVDSKTIWWYLDADYDIELWDNNDPSMTVYIEFNATVVDYGTNVNHVNVTGKERCSGLPLYGEDDATVRVPCQAEPRIDVEKKVLDPGTMEYVDGPLTVYYDDLGTPAQLKFQINVSNTGNVDLNNPVVTDILPDFLEYDSYTNSYGTLDFNKVGQNLTWTWIDQQTSEDDMIIILTVNVTSNPHEIKTVTNFVNVTVDENAHDEDTVDVTVKPHFILEKQVWNGTAWTEYLDHVRKGEPVKFRITATYYGDDLMKCLVIGDILPDICLEYADNEKIWIAGYQITSSSSMWPDIYIGEGETIVICDEIEGELPEGVIVWDWRNAVFGLDDGESVIIEFETSVTEYCDDCGNYQGDCCPPPRINPNCAIGLIWGCMQCTPCSGYKDLDCAFVRCCPPPITFEKKVLDGDEWVDEIETVVGNTLIFKLEFEYYGDENLTEIQFVDELPCILEYADDVIVGIHVENGDAELDEFGMSDDGKMLYWNFTGNLTDSGKITITFGVEVTGSTGTGCCSGDCECVNYAEVNGEIGCPPEYLHMEDIVDITALSNCPPSIPQLTGDTKGEEDETLTFKAYTTDSDGDKVFYKFDYDGYTTDWLGPYIEGVEKTFTHSWSVAGTYDVKVKAKDEHGAESDWTTLNSLSVEITEEPASGLKICFAAFNYGSVGATLKNSGTGALSGVEWNMSVNGGLLGRVDAYNNGTETIGAGNSTSICSGVLQFGLGKVSIVANAVVPGEDPIKKEATGFIIGKIVIIL